MEKTIEDNLTQITVSLVLFCNNKEELKKAITCVLSSNLVSKIYLIDNSPTNELQFLKEIDTKRIEYLFQNKNLGFGKAHNIAIKKSIELNFKYHLVINPDIHFKDKVIEEMISHCLMDNTIGMMMPEILNDDGQVQNLPKLLPTPFSVFMRKIKKPKKYYKKFINKYELRFVPQNTIYNVPILSGCFTLLNVKAIKEIGCYDDSFFMYFEDWDLSRRMHRKFKTIYFPEVSVFHGYESGANKSSKLFKIFVKSYIIYFCKWGWFFDFEREKVNNKVLQQF